MSDLAAFLTARLDEDEAVAKAATEGPWAWAATGEKDNSWAVALVGDADEEEKMLSGRIEAGDGIIIDPVCEGINGNLPDAAHIARHDPARALRRVDADRKIRSEEHTSELQSPDHLVCRLLLEKKKKTTHLIRYVRLKETDQRRT